MVRNYKRKTQRQSWSEEFMSMAVEAVITGKKGARTAATLFNVPQTTLERRILRYKNNPDSDAALAKGMGHWKRIFSNEQEDELVSCIKCMEERIFGVTAREIRQLAFQYAEKNKVNHPFNKNTGIAGADWLVGFLKRHPEVSTCKPDSAATAKALRLDEVAEFFKFGLAYSESVPVVVTTSKFEKTDVWPGDENISASSEFTTRDTDSAKIERVPEFKGSEMRPGPSRSQSEEESISFAESSLIPEFLRSSAESMCTSVTRSSSSTSENSLYLAESRRSRRRSTLQCEKTISSSELSQNRSSDCNKIELPDVPSALSANSIAGANKRIESDEQSVESRGWIQCTECQGWAHRSCAGVDHNGGLTAHTCQFSDPKCVPSFRAIRTTKDHSELN